MVEIVDAHVHIGHLNDAISLFGEPQAHLEMDADIASRVRAMEAIGIAWAVIQPSHGYLRPEGIKDTMRVNDSIAEYRRRDPVHFPIACGTVEPMHGERSLAELERIKHDLKLNGVSWHHRFAGCTIDSRWMWPILEKMRELDLAPVFHTNAESHFEAAWQLQRLARDFPDMNFLALDAFYAYERGNHVLGSASLSPNIIWDIGGVISWITPDLWVRHNGSRTLTFSGGASYPIAPGAKIDKPRLLEQIERSPMPEADKANILGRNIRRLFKLPEEGPVRPPV